LAEAMTLQERKAALDAIAAEILVCTKCPLYTGRTRAVPGAGPIDAEILFIGEGPGFHEDKQGLPFVGQAGKFLEELLAEIGMHRDQVFITNVVKCRPPQNRDPLPLEVDTCTSNYLYRQIELINPKIIVTLGRYSMGLFFPKAKITAIHGRPKYEDGRYYLPLFHPAAVLRNIAVLKPQAVADFKKIPELLKEARKKQAEDKPDSGAPNPPPSEPPKQLSLF
jgi:DNA polymerase